MYFEQKSIKDIDPNLLIKNIILTQNKNLESLFQNKLEYLLIYISQNHQNQFI